MKLVLAMEGHTIILEFFCSCLSGTILEQESLRLAGGLAQWSGGVQATISAPHGGVVSHDFSQTLLSLPGITGSGVACHKF